ncbi:50S ribosomal protein L3 [Candidatus Gracilibacteria bacterium]|nr:50S ribosomal protein L3 [Candidatus Gracilibacteria bacterium]
MFTGFLATKVGMSQIIDNETGKITPVTYISVEENIVTQIKTIEKDGYNAVVLGTNKYNKPTKTRIFKNVKEFKVDSVEGIKIGDKVNLSDFEGMGECHVTGVSKGKGFAGPVKRWNRTIARKTHGTKYIRHGSTMNSCITGRSKKGIKMAGHMGNENTTLKFREVSLIDLDENVFAIKGPIPGFNGGSLIIKKA